MTTAENISFSPSLYFRYTYTILTLYEHYTNTEGKSASWCSRVCDEQPPKYKWLLFSPKTEKYPISIV